MKLPVRFPYVLTELFLLLTATGFILFPGFHGYSRIQEEKAMLFLLLFGGYLILMALFALERILTGRLGLVSPAALWKRAGWTRRLAVVYFAVSAAATALSPWPVQAFWGMSRYEGLLTIGIYCGCFLCVSVFGRPSVRLLYCFGGTMALFCGVCLLQFFGYDPFRLYPGGLDYYDANILYPGSYLGTTGNGDYGAALLCLAIPILFWFAFWHTRRRDLLLLLPLALCLIVLVRMDVKAGLVGVAAGGLVSMAVILPKETRHRVVLWGLLAVFTVIGLTAVKHLPVSGVLYELQQIMHGNWADHFGSGRIYIWKTVWQRIPEHCLLGVGPDTMIAAGIPGFDFTAGERTLSTVIDAAHNDYLNILYHQGILGLAAYAGFLLTLGWKWVRAAGRRDPVPAALGSGALCWCIQGFFGISVSMTTGLFWVVLGLIEGSCPGEREGREEEDPPFSRQSGQDRKKE